ncbi:MAG: hypothetical protein KGL21_05970 [Alphaproteobacteria bacterium]|nr:hypothetical protein [Alphaproteobacteria bacterium]
MKKTLVPYIASAIGFVIVSATPAFADDLVGSYKRPNGDLVAVTETNGQLYCSITKGSRPGFEMCHGMTSQSDGSWQGAKMKHPSMPGFMTFNGTVTHDAKTLTIKATNQNNYMQVEISQ